MGEAPQITSAMQFRTFRIERDTLETRAGDDAIPIAISSETPVERDFGQEILSHTRDAIDLSHARDGLPFLKDHDSRTQIGIVRGLKVGSDNVLRGRVTFGNHPDAEWIRKDVLGGIRPSISVGYTVHSMRLTGSDAERGDVYTVDKWAPREVSSVPIPADSTVGVNRAGPSAEGPRRPGTTGGEGGIMSRTTEDIRSEISNIYALAAEHGVGPEAAANAVERGLSRDAFAREILDRKIGQHRATQSVGVDLSEREHRNYRINKAILAQHTGDWKGAGLEREVSEALAKTAPSTQGGVFIPWNTRASVTGNIVGTSSLGGAAVATEMRELIEILRNQLVVAQAGARFMPGLQGNISYPRMISTTSSAWIGENPSSSSTLTAATFDNVLLSPKVAQSSSAYSRQFLAQSSFDAASVVLNDLATVNAIALDYAAINGVGSSNQPLGIRNQSGIGNRTLGSGNGANLAWADIVALETAITTANADIGSISFITTPAVRGKLKTTLIATSAGSAMIWGPDDKVNGYRAFCSNQMPSGLTAGTSTTIAHGCLFGVFSELMVGLWAGGIEVLSDPYTEAGRNVVVCHSFMMADVGVRHPAAFIKSDQVLVS